MALQLWKKLYYNYCFSQLRVIFNFQNFWRLPQKNHNFRSESEKGRDVLATILWARRGKWRSTNRVMREPAWIRWQKHPPLPLTNHHNSPIRSKTSKFLRSVCNGSTYKDLQNRDNQTKKYRSLFDKEDVRLGSWSFLPSLIRINDLASCSLMISLIIYSKFETYRIYGW